MRSAHFSFGFTALQRLSPLAGSIIPISLVILLQEKHETTGFPMPAKKETKMLFGKVFQRAYFARFSVRGTIAIISM